MTKPNKGFTALVAFVVKPTDKDALESAATARELSVSELMRNLALEFLAKNEQATKEATQTLG